VNPDIVTVEGRPIGIDVEAGTCHVSAFLYVGAVDPHRVHEDAMVALVNRTFSGTGSAILECKEIASTDTEDNLI